MIVHKIHIRQTCQEGVASVDVSEHEMSVNKRNTDAAYQSDRRWQPLLGDNRIQKNSHKSHD